MNPVWDILVYVVLPLWIAAGFLDYLCHRGSDIEHANGAKESALHWLMLGEVGVPLLALTFLKVNALLMVFSAACLVAHEITSHLDLRLATRTRVVTAFEQQVHSVLEMMPLTAMLLVFILHWGQLQALLGFGPEHADFSLALKPQPGWTEIVALAVAFLVFGIVPYLEELVRGLRAERRNSVSTASRSA